MLFSGHHVEATAKAQVLYTDNCKFEDLRGYLLQWVWLSNHSDGEKTHQISVQSVVDEKVSQAQLVANQENSVG